MTTPTIQEVKDYVLMLMAMHPNLAVKETDQDLLTSMLWIACTGKDFEITLDDIVNLFKKYRISKQKSHLKRQLLFLRPGIDFKEGTETKEGEKGPGRPRETEYLTVEAFKTICLRAKTPVRNLLTQYFLLVEKEFRNNALHAIQKRRLTQSPTALLETEKKLVQARHERFRAGPCIYILGVFDEHGRIQHLKEGWCGDMNTRYPQLVAQYYGFATKVLFHMLTNNNPLAVEQCGFNETPTALQSPWDREIVDTPLDQAIENLVRCNAFMTHEKQRNEDLFKQSHQRVQDDSRDLWNMSTITK